MSNADKRTVHTDALATLGTIIDNKQKRDAIHLAVIPARCGVSRLEPGEHVMLDADGTACLANKAEDALGIVDPFLRVNVAKDQWFWLVIYPRVITSLRHVWTHPKLEDELGSAPSNRPTKSQSESWLRQYAARFYDYTDPDKRYAKLLQQMRDGELCYEGTDMHSFGDLVDAEELREHTENVLGIRIDYDRFDYFSCTC